MYIHGIKYNRKCRYKMWHIKYISIFYTIRLVKKKKNISYACWKYIRKYAEGNTILVEIYDCKNKIDLWIYYKTGDGFNLEWFVSRWEKLMKWYS